MAEQTRRSTAAAPMDPVSDIDRDADLLTSGDLQIGPQHIGPQRIGPQHADPQSVGPPAGSSDAGSASTESGRPARARHAAVPGDEAPTVPIPTVAAGSPAPETDASASESPAVVNGWHVVSNSTLDPTIAGTYPTADTDTAHTTAEDSSTPPGDPPSVSSTDQSTEPPAEDVGTQSNDIHPQHLPDTPTSSTDAVPPAPHNPVADVPQRESAIEVVNLHKRFGDNVAVESVSFSVAKGSILALLGPNGAGKTTTVNMLCTLLKPDGGSASVAGHDVVSDAPGVRRSIMLTGQFAALDEALSGRENLILFGRLMGLTRSAARARADDLLTSFELTDAANRKVGEYSGGMRRRIDIACGLVTQPEVVFLDEPTTGLDPRSRLEVWKLVESLRDQGVTTLLTTQYLEEADTLSDHIVVIDRGRVIASGTADELKAATGASHYEVSPADPDDLNRLVECLGDLVPAGTARRPSDDSSDDPDERFSVAVPAPAGADTLVAIVQRTTQAGIRLSDVALRRPSLDEVFLALTDPARPDGTGAPRAATPPDEPDPGT